MDDMARIWPIIVQFGGGFVLCAVGLRAGIQSKYLDMQNSEDKRLIAIIVGGYVFLLVLSCMFTFWLPNIPVEAAQ